MAALATIADLKARFPPVAFLPDAALQDALDDAESALTTSLRRKVLKRAAVVSEVDGVGRDRLILPEYPVAAIASVSIDGQPLDASDYRTKADEGILIRKSCPWPVGAVVRVDYTAGYDPVPRDLIRGLLTLAWIYADRQDPEANADEGEAKRVKLGPAEVEYHATAAPGGNRDPLPWEVECFVSPYRREA